MNRMMKDSGIAWIGEIPEDWNFIRLKYLGYVKGRIGFKGYTVSDLVDEDTEGCAIVLGGTNVMRNGYISYDKLTYISKFKYLESPEIMLKGNEILITKVGAGTGENAIYSFYKDRVTINPNIMIFVPDNTSYSKYINYSLLSHYIKEDIYLESNKSGAQPAINQSYVSNIKIVLPNSKKINSISVFLERKISIIDQTIEKQKQIIEKLKEYKQSIITEAVTKGLDPNVKMKDSGIEWIGEIPEHWEIIRLGIVGNVQTGPFGSQLHNDDYVEEGIPIITVEHFGENVIKHNNLPYVSAEDYERLKKYVMINGDLIFSRVGSVDRCVLVSEKEDGWLFSGRCLRVRFNEEVNSKFIGYCFNKKRFREYMNLIAVGSTMPSINTSILNNIRIPVPSNDEQEKINSFLTKKCSLINNAIYSYNKMVNKLETLKKSLIYECVTGKKEVE